MDWKLRARYLQQMTPLTLPAALDAAILMGRMAQPSEIAGVVVFLASGKSAYLTATTVFIDGGIIQGSVDL